MCAENDNIHVVENAMRMPEAIPPSEGDLQISNYAREGVFCNMVSNMRIKHLYNFLESLESCRMEGALAAP